MKRATAVVATLFFLIGASVSTAGTLRAKAELIDASGKVIGTAKFSEGADGVKIHVEARGFSIGLHGIHIHAIGKCDPPEWKTAGGHFNPEGKKHGFKSGEGPHAGDLPNLVVKNDPVKADLMAHGVTLKEGKDSLFQPDGTALVIHAGPDDETTDPAGSSGPRVACGVIVRE